MIRNTEQLRPLQFVAALLALSVAAGCGGGGGGESEPAAGNDTAPPANQSDTGEQQEQTETTCTNDLESLVAGLETKTPTWDELSCFTEDLERFERPAFIKRILLGSDTLPEDATAWTKHLEQVEQTWAEWPINVGNTLSGPLPPYDSPDGRAYPLSEQDLDLVMRSYATVLLYEKTVHDRPLFFSNFWPPEAVKEFDSYQGYLTWMEDIYLPELEKVAETAEFVKAEYFMPFLLEAEVFGNGLGEWSEELSEAARVAIAQDFVDRIYDVVRPIYTGTLIASSYARYAAFGDFWQNISYNEYDQVNFGLFPECNIEVTEDYLDDQFEKYMTIVARDSVPYMINELTVYRDKLFVGPCPSFDFDANEDALYQTILDRIDLLPIAPIGLSAGAPISEEARAVLADYFNSKP